MKRYFTFATPPDPVAYHPRSFYHWMSLPESGYVCVLQDGDADPHPDWVEIASLLDGSPANFNGINMTPGAYVAPALASGATAQATPASIAGVSPTDTMFQAAKKLGIINPLFRP
jgi:hypothetical protein